MNSRQLFSIVILFLGLTAAMIPTKKNDAISLNEHELLQEMLRETNYVTSDELAERLIAADPSVQLIDVRPASTFRDPLPGAINIPIDSLFSENYSFYFDQVVRQNIIYSQDDVLATQVWMITKQLGYKNNYLLKGGISEWKQTILDPQTPQATASGQEWDLYNKRMAARQYFTGDRALPKVETQQIIPIQTRKKKRVSGSCS
ncbi:MAG: rhodanese-like domain-containing protein [Bacteroidota bacterium]